MNPKQGLFGRPDDEPSPKIQELIERLRSIMDAAADEIEEHWEAHCDEDGFGPVNLVRRLRTGKGDYRTDRGER
jgi:hypothetical protein